MKEKYYFIKTKRAKVPIATVYLLKDGDEWSRGFSLLSFRDKLKIKDGKDHARKYAYRGFYGKQDDNEIVRLDAFDMLDIIDVPFFKKRKRLYKSMYKPTLTSFEKKLLEN